MGLDMYLEKKRFFFSKNTRKKIVDNNTEFNGLKEIVSVDSAEIYWRKFNALHNWFVNNVQDGDDNCQPHSVSIENIQEILQILIKIKKANDEYKEGRLGEEERNSYCQDLLPPCQGFFFGNTDLDDDYFYDVEYSITEFQRVLSEHESEKDKKSEYFDEYYYQSSW